MDFITQFENTLVQAITQKRFADAHALLQAYPATGQPYTFMIFSSINRLRQEEYPFSFPLPDTAFRLVFFQTGNFILDYIANQFSSFFQEKGHSVLYFNPSDYTKSSEALFSFAKEGIDAAFFFNNVGLHQTISDGRNLWETLGIPCYDFLVDHPMYYADSLDDAPAHTTLLCADLTHTDYVRRFYPNVENAIFLPTGGCDLQTAFKDNPDPGSQDTGSDCPWNERPIDVLFIGSFKYHSDDALEQSELAQNIISYMMTHTDRTFEQAVEACTDALSKYNPAQFCDSASLCSSSHIPEPHTYDERLKFEFERYRFLETNVTATYRKAIIEELLQAGITVHVYGEGWQQTGLTNYENFVLHAPVSFKEGIRQMSQAKIVLNHMAWFKHGSSERIFNAMSQGAVCVTDSSRYLDTILKDQYNCCIYSLDDPSVSSRIQALLKDPETSQKIALEGQKTSQEHTWFQHLFVVTSS